MIINGEHFTNWELMQWEESENGGKPVKNVSLIFRIISVLASALLGWHK